jgi:hypothetical protein
MNLSLIVPEGINSVIATITTRLRQEVPGYRATIDRWYAAR